MLEILTDPLGEEFMRRALTEITLIGLPAGLLGCWIVLYGISYAAESVAHSIFPGLVLAALAGLPLILGGAPALLLGAVAIALLARLPRIDRDTATAVVITGFFGFGSLSALSAATPPGLDALLFGDILGVSNSDLVFAAALTVTVLVGLWLSHGRLLAVGFDPASARSLGARPGLTELALMLLLAVTVLIAVQGLGNLLVVAVLVGPAATARLLSDRLVRTMAISAALAVGLGLLGLYLSYYAGTAAGASIALAYVAAYLAVATARGIVGTRIAGKLPAARYDHLDAG